MHQGGLKTATNLGSYFGAIYEAQYLSGIAAGHATKTDKLGYVVAFPIPQTLLNINAFELGAKSVNPKATTTVVFTSAWCDPGKQAEATNSLVAQKVDVISSAPGLHEDDRRDDRAQGRVLGRLPRRRAARSRPTAG